MMAYSFADSRLQEVGILVQVGVKCERSEVISFKTDGPQREFKKKLISHG